MTAIIDYDAGNIKSVEKALLALGEETIITRDPKVLLEADHVILPGVGSFGDAMDKLCHYGLVETIKQIVQKGTPFLGICLGLQLLFEESEESKGVKGLGLLKGKILRIPDGPGLKIPHIGWNSLKFPHKGEAVFGTSGRVLCIFCAFLLFEGCRRRNRNGHNRVWHADPCFRRKKQYFRMPIPP